MRVSFGPFKQRLCLIIPAVALAAIILISSLPTSAVAQTVLRIQVLDTAVSAADPEGTLTIAMDNYVDTVAGFALWLMLDRPDLIVFQTDPGSVTDTNYWYCLSWQGEVCVESLLVAESDPWDWFTVGTLPTDEVMPDTTGTLISGWQFVDGRSLSGTGTDAKVAGIANMINPPTVPGIGPQQGGILFKLPFDIIGDPVSPEGEIVNVIVIANPEHFSFADPQGQTIGLKYDTIPDTACYICLQWAGEVCLNWQRIPMGSGECDSIQVDTIIVPSLDTGVVEILYGAVTVYPSCLSIVPGDLDGDGSYDISELALLISYIRFGTPPLPFPWNADVNGDCVINWEDANLLEAGGPFVDCTCIDPQWVCCRGIAGNFNYDRLDDCNVVDLTDMVAYMFTGGPPPYCFEEADVDPTGDPPGINVSDLTFLVAYLFTGGETPADCPVVE